MLMEGSRAFWRKCHINLRFLLCNLCVHETLGWYGISNTEHCKGKAKVTQSLLFCNTWWHSLGRRNDAITMKLNPTRLDEPKEFICAIYVIAKNRSSYFHLNNNNCFHWGAFMSWSKLFVNLIMQILGEFRLFFKIFSNLIFSTAARIILVYD